MDIDIMNFQTYAQKLNPPLFKTPTTHNLIFSNPLDLMGGLTFTRHYSNQWSKHHDHFKPSVTPALREGSRCF